MAYENKSVRSLDKKNCALPKKMVAYNPEAEDTSDKTGDNKTNTFKLSTL